jgi:hypothetical protein
MPAFNMGFVNSFLYGAGGGPGGRSRMAARVAGRWGAISGIARAGGAIGVVEAVGRPVGNAALRGMMFGAAANTGLQIFGNVSNGQNAFAGTPGAAIRGAMFGGFAGGAFGVGNAFMGAPTRLARNRATTAAASPAMAAFSGPAGMHVTGRPTRSRVNPGRAIGIPGSIRAPRGVGPAMRAHGRPNGGPFPL